MRRKGQITVREISKILNKTGSCVLSTSCGVKFTVEKFSFKNNPLTLAKGKGAEDLKQLFSSKGDHGFYVATFLLRDLPAYLMFQKDHLPELCNALRTRKSLENCWCYKLIYGQQVFTIGTPEWKAVWNAIIKNGSPYLEAVILSPRKGK